MFIRNIRNPLVLAAAAALAVLAAEPAQAEWLEFGIGGAPMCPGNRCPTLQTSCESAAYQYWGSNWPGTLVSVSIIDTYYAECEILILPPYGSTTATTHNICSAGSRVSSSRAYPSRAWIASGLPLALRRSVSASLKRPWPQ